MQYPDEDEPSPPLPWIEDEEAVEDALRDVMVPHEAQTEAAARRDGDPDGGDGPNGDGDSGGGDGADGDSSRRRRGRAA